MLSVLCWLSGYAQLKVVEKPYFLGGETRLEVSRVSLYDDRTVVDVDYYAGAMGDEIRLSPSATLSAGGKQYALKKAEGISTAEDLEVAANGKVSMQWTFEPLPLDVATFDFQENVDRGWKLNQIHLDGKKPKSLCLNV